MSATWKWLHGFQSPLLLKYDFGPTNYAIWLTDLQNLWLERLDRKSLLRRALSKDMSIDPSEDASQMQKFLSHVRDALDLKSQTDLRISSDNEGSTLNLHLRATISESLPELEWTCELTECSSTMFTQAIVLPLLASQSTAQLEREFLLARIREKDAVISKLMVQMQADGSDFSKTFPGSVAIKSHGKADARQALSRSIKGIGEFDQIGWQDRARNDVNDPNSMECIMQRIDPVVLEGVDPCTTAQSDKAWWNVARHSLPSRTRENVDKAREDQRKHDVDDSMEASPDRDFQRQPTPQRESQAQSRNRTFTSGQSELDAGESTTDDSQDETQPFSRQRGIKQGSTDFAHSEQQPISPNLSIDQHNESDAHKPSKDNAESTAETTDSPMSKPKAKLGRIGGKKAIDDGPHTGNRPKIAQELADNHSWVKSTNGPLERGRQEAQAEDASEPRETSIERANRNRERLKHELDSKAQAGKKKRRKF